MNTTSSSSEAKTPNSGVTAGLAVIGIAAVGIIGMCVCLSAAGIWYAACIDVPQIAAVAANPNPACDPYQRGVAALDNGDYQSAVTQFSLVIKDDPSRAEAYQMRGHSYLGLGQVDNALQDYSRAIELDPTNADYYAHRGYVYGELGRPEDAVRDSARAIELDPNQAAALNNRAWYLAKLDRNLNQALEDVNRAIQLQPDEPSFVDTRAYVYYKRGDYDLALVDALAALDAGHTFTNYTVGLIYEAQGNRRQAIESYTRFLDEFGGYTEMSEVIDAKERLFKLDGGLPEGQNVGRENA